MINLIRLKLKNFLSFEEVELDLSKAGLYLISGFNEKSGDSNGAGKSSILDSICFALFGKTSTGLGPTEVQKWDTKEMLVELELTDGTNKFLISRKGADISFYENGKPTGATHKRDIQSVINDIFKTSYDIFVSSTFFANRRKFLAEQTDADKKLLFKPIFQLDRLDKAYDNSKRKYDDTMINLDNLSHAVEYKHKLNKERLATQENYSWQIQTWEKQIQDSISAIQTTKSSIDTSVSQDMVQRVDDLSDKIAMLQDDVDINSKLADAWNEEWRNERIAGSVTAVKLNENAEALAETQEFKSGTNCRYCGQPLTEENLKKHKDEVRNEQARLTQQASECSARGNELDRLLLNHQTKLERLTSLKESHASAKANLALRLEQIEYNKQRLSDLDIQLVGIGKSKCPYAKMASDLQTQIDITIREISEADKEIAELSSDLDAYGFLKWVFSKEGVSSYIIERAFGRLESLANRYLSNISSEGFQIEMKPQKELKSKAIKEEIDIVIKTEGKRVTYWALSGGQRQRVNIALLLSVYRLCRDRGINSFNFLLLDEILDLSLADKGQEDTLKLLRMLLSSEVHNIFVISHRPEVAADVDYVIGVRRGKDEISRLE